MIIGRSMCTWKDRNNWAARVSSIMFFLAMLSLFLGFTMMGLLYSFQNEMLSLPTFYIGTFAYIPTILFSNGGILCAITSYAANLLHVDVTDQNPVNKSKTHPILQICHTIFILTVLSIMIACFIVDIQIHVDATKSFSSAMKLYKTDVTVKSVIDEVQTLLACCGSVEATDWFDIMWKDEKTHKAMIKNGNQSSLAMGVPYSCCSSKFLGICHHLEITDWRSWDSPTLKEEKMKTSISQVGCGRAVADYAQNSILLPLSITMIVFMLIEAFGLIMYRIVYTSWLRAETTGQIRAEHWGYVIACGRSATLQFDNVSKTSKQSDNKKEDELGLEANDSFDDDGKAFSLSNYFRIDS